MIINLENRRKLLSLLPTGGVVCELGVQHGQNSKDILEIVKPNLLCLVDCWAYQKDPGHKKINVKQSEQNIIFNNVTNMFKKNIDSGQVKIYREYTRNAVLNFEDRFFDWIYVDADHRYKQVLEDLTLYESKLKLNGFFVGDDYYMDKDRFGKVEVKKAVKNFIKTYDFVLDEILLKLNTDHFILRRPWIKILKSGE